MSKKIEDKPVQLNIDQLKKRLKHIIRNNRELQARGLNPLATAIEGESGFGKTSMTLQVAEEEGLDWFKLNLAQIEELGDLVGFPIRQFEMVREEGEDLHKTNHIKWVDEHATQGYVNQGYNFTGNNRTDYCPPFWISGKKKGGILILDDWTRADVRFIQAVMELIDRQTYISWKLPEDWHIILTSNPDNGEYNVNSIDKAQLTRFINFQLKFDMKIWAKWAEENKIDGRCINFMLRHPEILEGTGTKSEESRANVNARSVTNFFNSLYILKDFSTPESLEIIQDIGSGTVGGTLTNMFSTFIHNKLDKLISPDRMLDYSVKTETIVKEIQSNVTTGDEYQAAIGGILVTRLINYVTLNAKDASIVNKQLSKRLTDIVKAKVFSMDQTYLLVRQIYNSNPQVFSQILSDQALVDIVLK